MHSVLKQKDSNVNAENMEENPRACLVLKPRDIIVLVLFQSSINQVLVIPKQYQIKINILEMNKPWNKSGKRE